MRGVRAVQARKAQQVELDRRHLDTTQLRSGRIRRLRDLCEQGGGGGDHRAITMNGDGGDEGDGDGGDGGGGGGPACGVRYLCQVPDGAVKEEAAEGERGAARLPQPLSNGAPPGEAACSASLAVAGPAAGAIAATDAAAGGPALHRPRQCYTCKARFVALHHFYASLCPKCAALNFRMRHAAQCRRHTRARDTATRAACLRALCCPWRAGWWHAAAEARRPCGAVPLRRVVPCLRRGASAAPCPAQPF